MSLTITPPNWTPDAWHGVEGFPRQWRRLPTGHIEEHNHVRQQVRHVSPTNANANLAAEVWQQRRAEIEFAHDVTGVSMAEIAALIATESVNDNLAGGPDSWTNKHGVEIIDSSWGLCQTLTDTALLAGRLVGWPRREPGVDYHDDVRSWLMPWKSEPRGGSREEWALWLQDTFVGVTMGALVYRVMSERHDTRGDPLLRYAAYNAGGLRRNDARRYGIDCTASAVAAFVLFLNGVVEVMG